MRLLLNRRANINIKVSDRLTALYYIAVLRYEVIVQLLLNRGADINIKDSNK